MAKKKKKSLSEGFKELEEITEKFESGEIELEKAIPEFKKAVRLAKDLKSQLNTLESEIEEISLDFTEEDDNDSDEPIDTKDLEDDIEF